MNLSPGPHEDDRSEADPACRKLARYLMSCAAKVRDGGTLPGPYTMFVELLVDEQLAELARGRTGPLLSALEAFLAHPDLDLTAARVSCWVYYDLVSLEVLSHRLARLRRQSSGTCTTR